MTSRREVTARRRSTASAASDVTPSGRPTSPSGVGTGRRGSGTAVPPSEESGTPAALADPAGESGIRDASGRLDERSKRIIEQLQEDGRRSYAAIARAVGLSEAATRQRVQRLIEEGIVQIVAVTRAEAVGFRRQALIGVQTEGEVRSVASRLAALPEAEYVIVCAGKFDVLVELVCEDDEHLLRVIDEGVRAVPGVRTTETFVYLRLEKETYQWGTR